MKLKWIILIALIVGGAGIYGTLWLIDPNLGSESRITLQKTLNDLEHAGHDVIVHLENGIAKVQPYMKDYGYWAVFVAVLVEGFGVPMPGLTLIIAGSMEAAQGELNIGILIVVALTAAIVGNTIGYCLGLWGGHRLLMKLPLKPHHLEKMEKSFDHWGGNIIVLARFFEGLKQLNGFVAGALEMPWWHFQMYNILGALLWVGLYALGTYFMGRDIHSITAFIYQVNPYIATASLIALVVTIVLSVKLRRKKTEAG